MTVAVQGAGENLNEPNLLLYNLTLAVKGHSSIVSEIDESTVQDMMSWFIYQLYDSNVIQTTTTSAAVPDDRTQASTQDAFDFRKPEIKGGLFNRRCLSHRDLCVFHCLHVSQNMEESCHLLSVLKRPTGREFYIGQGNAVVGDIRVEPLLVVVVVSLLT